jgi:hypothetical protein
MLRTQHWIGQQLQNRVGERCSVIRHREDVANRRLDALHGLWCRHNRLALPQRLNQLDLQPRALQQR